MATLNSEIASAWLAHATYVQRYSAGTAQRIVALLNRTDADLVAQLAARLDRIVERGFDTGPATTKRLAQLLDEVRAINQQAYAAAGKELTAELRNFTAYEAQWTQSNLTAALPAAVSFTPPPVRTIVAAALARPFQGRLLSESLDGLEQSRAARIRDAIRIGMVEGQTTDQIVRRIRGTRAAGYADGLLEIDRRGAYTMVRTAVSHVADYARESVLQENADLISKVQWHATLDGRTCPVCAALDGKTFAIDAGPRTPRHFGCRCTRIPVVKSWRELGIDIEEMPSSTRASINGQVPESLTYGDWLRKQSKEFQDEVLGPGRAELFRSGMPIERFTDRAGNELSLAQLRQSDPPVPKPTGDGLPVVPSKGGSLAAAQSAAEADAIDYVRINGTRDRIEYAAAYFADGSAGLRKAGEASSVSFTEAEIKALADTTLVHNHPRGSSLSGADLIFAAYAKIREIIAVPSAGGGLFRAAPLLSFGDISKAYQSADRYVRTQLRKAVAAGAITADEASALHAHFVNEALDHVGVVAYKASVTPAIEAAIAAYGADQFELAVEAFKWNL